MSSEHRGSAHHQGWLGCRVPCACPRVQHAPDAAGAAPGCGRQRNGAGKEAAGSGAQPGGSKKGGAQPGGQQKCGAKPVQGNDGDGKEYIVCRRCKKPKEVDEEISKPCAELQDMPGRLRMLPAHGGAPGKG